MQRDGLFFVALAAGPLACLAIALLPGVDLHLGWPWAQWPVLLLAVLAYPVLEEIVFRGGLQPALARRLPAAAGPLTLANLLTSVVFCGLHFLFHPPLWAAGVFLPSLVFGYFYERHNGLAAPIVLHAVYNASYFLLLA